MDFNEAGDDGISDGSGIRWTICKVSPYRWFHVCVTLRGVPGRAVVRTDLALASAEARQTLTLLLADRLVVLPVHVSTAVAAVPARVRIAPAHHVRVLPV